MLFVSTAEPQPNLASVDCSDRLMIGLGLFLNYRDAEIALDKLRQSIISAAGLSFLAKCKDLYDDRSVNLSPVSPQRLEKSSESQYVGFVPATSMPTSHDVLARLTSLVNSLSLFNLQEIGPAVVGGCLHSIISSHHNFKGSVVEALVALGVPEQSAALYRDRLVRGDCLIGIEGSSQDIAQAKRLLRHCRIVHWQSYRV